MNKKKLVNRAKQRVLPSNHKEATINRAGGVAFKIKDAATRLITMTGGAFFDEPKYYEPSACSWKKGDDNNERMAVVYENLKASLGFFEEPGKMDISETSREIMWAAIDVMNSDRPEDALKIAHWLRSEMNIRLTPQVILVLAAQHPALKGVAQSESLVRTYAPKIIQRPDEVKACLLLHRYFFGMKSLPHNLSLGIGDAIGGFNEYQLLKYDGNGFPRWKDVLGWIRRKQGWPMSKPLADYFIGGKINPEGTPLAYARDVLGQCKTFDESAKKAIVDGAMTWEEVLSWAGQGKIDKSLIWDYLVQNNLVPYMALLRNLRNIAQAGVNPVSLALVCEKISNREQVLKGKQLPFRFLAAVLALEEEGGNSPEIVGVLIDAVADALDISVENVTSLHGETVVFADNSGSMGARVSDKSTISCAMAANVLAGIVAKRSDRAAICAFATEVAPVVITKRNTVLDVARGLESADTKGHSTNAHLCLQWLIKRKNKGGLVPNRIIVLSDMQCWNSNLCSDGNFADEWHRYKKLMPPAYLHSVNLNGYGDAMTQAEPFVNLVGGFSEKIIDRLIESEGSGGKLEPQKPVATIEYIRSNF